MQHPNRPGFRGVVSVGVALLTILAAAQAARAQRAGAATRQSTTRRSQSTRPTSKPQGDAEQSPAEPVVAEHELKLPDDRTLKYKSTAGFIPLNDAKNKLRANVFFISYELQDQR